MNLKLSLAAASLATPAGPGARGGHHRGAGPAAQAVHVVGRDDRQDGVDDLVARDGLVLQKLAGLDPLPLRVAIERAVTLRVPDPRASGGSSEVTILDVAADGYRLRLVDHPAAFDREGFYGDAAGDYADNAWRFGLFCRAALEALRADDRPLDVLHLHDWHTGPAAIWRDER